MCRVCVQVIRESRQEEDNQLPPINNSASGDWSRQGDTDVTDNKPLPRMNNLNTTSVTVAGNQRHKDLNKKINSAYMMASALRYQPYPDTSTTEDENVACTQSGIDDRRVDELERRLTKFEEKTNLSLYNIEALLRRAVFQTNPSPSNLHKCHSSRRSKHRYDPHD